jgi:hypothetical protein
MEADDDDNSRPSDEPGLASSFVDVVFKGAS